ncbi:hypothetical protein [Pseudomonas sp. PMCC200344]|uniref:hypothetical protein n=1 Tax=Pseudomonas sp. PMCC200344 TaxID=3042028 RepID=UPI0024B32E16|nr:hypothetical protein [Pseudomonas sp. PMCC200344]
MNRPEPIMTISKEDTSSVAEAESWGEKEVSREIALLEASVHRDTITRTVEALESLDRAGATGELAGNILPVNIEDELKQQYLDYAMSVIVGRALSPHEAVGFLRDASQREMGLYSHRSHLFALCNGLKAALAIGLLEKAARSAANLLLKLKKASDSACFRIPLFAYGPELSAFRHRLR